MIGEKEKCFICGRNGFSDRLEKHHIFGGINRKNSEKYGLTVMLCGERCHRNGKYSAHKCKETRDKLHTTGQEYAMKKYAWSVEQFLGVFGKNYL